MPFGSRMEWERWQGGSGHLKGQKLWHGAGGRGQVGQPNGTKYTTRTTTSKLHGIAHERGTWNVKWQRVWVSACLFPFYPNVFLVQPHSPAPRSLPPAPCHTFSSCGFNLLLTLLKNYKPKMVAECTWKIFRFKRLLFFARPFSSFHFSPFCSIIFFSFFDLLRNNLWYWFSF